MERQVFLICNAHIDTMWLWEWEEGVAEALSTFRTAVRLAEKYDAFVFNHNEASLYMWIEEYEPPLFEKIKNLVKKGKWHVMGGWYIQPDCNMPSGEGFIRQIEVGNEYFKDKFGLSFETAVNFDSFGHSRGLVQILAKYGYKNYLVCRPSRQNLDIPDEFVWVGYDGSEVYVRRHFELYNSALGHASEKISNLIKEHADDPLCILWGVGNHGGGPSDKDLSDIEELTNELKNKGVKITHSTPDEYFKATKEENERKGKNVSRIDKSLRPCNTGCYTSMVRIKQGYKQLEDALLTVEKMCSTASLKGLMEYPYDLLKEAETDLLFCQFHDILPGTVIKEAEQTGLNAISHGMQILNRLKLKAFFALSTEINYKANGNYPVIVYNPHPYKVKQVIDCEFNLADQNWEDNFTYMKVLCDGKNLPCQIEKESSNLNLDWRKRVVFEAELQPMQIKLFECEPYKVYTREIEPLSNDGYSANGVLSLRINPETGNIENVSVNDKKYSSGSFGKLAVYTDTEDPWAMRSFQDEKLGNYEGCFEKLSDEESQIFSGVKRPLKALRIIESGDVRDVLECVYGYNTSKAVTRYSVYKNSKRIDVNVRVFFNEKDKCLKLLLPTCLKGDFVGKQQFGREVLRTDGGESVFGDWCGIVGKDGKGMFVINKGTYGASYENGAICLTLLRTPAYTGHPINDREILRQDRYTERMDQGERTFDFSILFDTDINEVDLFAQAYNEKYTALSFFPNGDNVSESLMTVDGAKLSSFYKSRGGYVLRISNPMDKDVTCKIAIPSLKIKEEIALKSFEFKTVLIKNGKVAGIK